MKTSMTGILIFFGLFAGAGPLLAQHDVQLQGVELQAMADTFQYALENNPSNESADWVNPDTTRSGAVVPTRTFENAQGQPCREFITTIIIADQEEQGYGTACRQPDGHWALATEANETAAVPPTVVNRTYVVRPPASYYAYPYGFFGSSNIYLSFDYVFRGSKLHRGRLYLDGRSFRNRYPHRVRTRIDLGPRISYRYRLHDELNYREWDRQNRKKFERKEKYGKKSTGGWREKRDDDRNDGKRGRKGRND